MANRFLSNIKINDAYTFPASDGSNGQVIVTDGAGNLTFANPATSSSASIIYRDNFTGDGSTTVFYLQNSLSDEDQTQIYIDGVYQEKGTYSLSNNAITFTTAPPNGDSVEVISISGINVGPTTIYQDNFTGDGTTTDFTLAQAVSDEVKTMVYFNGVYQFKGTYSLNGTLMSFDTAPTNGVAIEVISIASAAAADYNQKMLFYGKASEAISKGDAIMLGGQEGDHFLLAKATQAAIATNHEYFLGLASQDLAQGEFGYVTEFGKIIEIDTSGYTAGDILWFDAGGSTAGALTTTEPAAPLAKIQVAAVIRSHQNEGVLFIRPTWYHELGEMHDVNINSVANKDLLVWNDTAGYWENSKTVDTLTGNTLSATTLTGTLSTAAQTNITSVGTLSSLAVSGNLTVDTNTLFVDAANNRVGIGTISPSKKLHIKSSDNEGIFMEGTGGSGHWFDFQSTGVSNLWSMGAQSGLMGWYNRTDSTYKMVILDSGNVGIGVTLPNHKLTVDEDTTTSYVLSARNTNDNLQIKLGTTTGGYANIQASTVNTNDTYNMSIQADGGNLGVGTVTPATKLDIFSDGLNVVKWSKSGGQTGYLYSDSAGVGIWSGSGFSDTGIYMETDASMDFRVNGSQRIFIDSSGRVGVGSNTPIDKLNVNGGFTSTNLAAPSNTSVGSVQLGYDVTSGSGILRTWNSSPLTIQTYGDISFYTNGFLRASIDTSGIFSVGQKFRVDNYTTVGQTSSGAMSIFGHNVEVDTSSPNVVKAKNTGYFGQFIKMYYNQGISFHVVPSTVTAGDTLLSGTGANTYERIRVTSDGLTFNGDTAAANALDDYEEGTWTPTFSDQVNVTSLAKQGDAVYTKIGRVVHLTMEVSGAFTSSTAESLFSFTLPFSAYSSTFDNVGTASFFIGSGANRFGIGSVWLGTTSNGKTFIYIPAREVQQSGSWGQMRMSLTYFAQ